MRKSQFAILGLPSTQIVAEIIFENVDILEEMVTKVGLSLPCFVTS